MALIVTLSLLGHSFAHARLVQLFPVTYNDISSFLSTNKINSLEEYIDWLQQNVTYEKDVTKDNWADPLITLNKRSGDCEDIAFLNAAVLEHFGYEPRVLAYGQAKEAHVICLFIKEGKYFIFDNTKFYKDITSPSLKEIFVFLATKHHARYLLELKREPKQLTVLYTYQEV